ncbi:MAG: serine/threonine protein kinase, partial [Alphaproteobacteria bacterium]|nr:serine/threonine protein kinase [Alphaproteobacteria bacterium]
MIAAPIGRSGYGVTYRGLASRFHDDVVIKEFLPTAVADRQGGRAVLPSSPRVADLFHWGLGQFVEEAQRLKRLDTSSGIVRVLDVVEDNGTAYAVMAWAHGETLAMRLQRERRLSHHGIERLLMPLLEGVQAAHEAGLVHGDIQPNNILIDSAGRPTLIGFSGARTAFSARLQSATGHASGIYTAPELAPMRSAGPWTDIYNLSCTLYHCVTGQTPARGGTQQGRDIFTPAINVEGSALPAGLMTAILAGLKTDPTARPQSITDWRQLLEAAPSIAAAPSSVRAMRPAAAPAGSRAAIDPPTVRAPTAARPGPAAAATPASTRQGADSKADAPLRRVVIVERRSPLATAAVIAASLAAVAVGVWPLLQPPAAPGGLKRGMLADMPAVAAAPPNGQGVTTATDAERQ